MAESRSARWRRDRLGRRETRRTRASLLEFAPRTEFLEQRIALATDVWTGASLSSSNWSDDANWQDGSAPTTGADLIFPTGASRLTNTYDAALGVSSFGSIEIQDGGYDINGGTLTLTDGISATFASNTSEFHPDIALTGDITVDVVTDGDLILSGAISGSGFGVTKTGGGTLEFTGFSSNTYTGTTNVSGGTLILNRSSGNDAIAGDLVIGDNIGGGESVQIGSNNQIADGSNVTVNEGATFDVGTTTETIAALTLEGASVTIGSGGALTITNLATNATSNNVTSTISGGGSLDLGGDPALAVAIADDTDVAVDLRISAAIQNGGIAKSGVGTLGLSGANTYAGDTTVNAGAIQVESDTALGTTAGGTTVASGASVYFAGSGLDIAEGFGVDGTGVGGNNLFQVVSGDATLSGAVAMTGSIQIGAADGATLAINGVIDDDASTFGLTVSNGATGRTVLGGNNGFDGNVSVTSGYLRATNDGALGDTATSSTSSFDDVSSLELSGGVTIPATKSMTLSLNGVGGTAAKVINLAGDNTIDGAIVMTGNEEFQQVGGTTLNLNGVISEDASGHRLISSGSGVLILNATNTYTGTTFVTAGTLLVAGSIATSSDVQVFAAVLGGSGTLPDVTIGSGGTLAPGNSPGLVNTGNLAFQSGSTYSVEIDGTTVGTQYDQTDVTGSVTLAGATLSVSLGYAPAIGDSFIIINNDGSDAVSGTFNGLAEGSTFTVGNVEFSISYAGGSNSNDVVLTVTGVTYTWTGLGGDSNWSTDANWDTNLAPVGGEDLVFPSGAARLNNNNDLSGKSFHSIEVDGSGYFITGNSITLTDGFLGTYASGTTTFAPGIALTATESIDVFGGGTLDLAGVISGSFGVTKGGGGTLRYSGSSANTYNQTTTINAGTLVLAKSNDVIAANGSVIVGDNSVGSSLQVAGNNQFWVGADVTVNEGSTFDVGTYLEHISNLNLQGSTVLIDTGGVLATFVGVNTYATTNNVTSAIQGLGALQIDNSLNTFTIADDVSVPIDLRISTAIVGLNPTSGLTMNGPGTVALSGSNSFGGDVTVSSGAIQVESDTALGTTDGATTVASGASVYFAGIGLTIAEGFGVDGTGVGGNNLFQVVSGDATLSGAVAMTGSIQIGAADGATLTINGVIDDDASTYYVEIINGPTGRTVLGGSNLFDGALYADTGFIRATNDNAFGDPSTSSTVSVGTGGSVELVGGIAIPSTKSFVLASLPVANSSKIINLSGDNTLAGPISIINNNQSFDVAGGTTLTVSGAISGSVDFDKNNTGTLILTGTNTNTGNVSVGNGTLIVNGSLATSNSVFVDGVLGGSGTLPAVTISSIGTLSPGNSPGIVNTGNLAFSDSGSTYSVELDGTTVGTQYDQADVTGTVTLAGATLSTSLGYAPAIGDTYTIINNDGSDAVSGTFNGLAEGSTISIGNATLSISYAGGSNNNDVVLTVTNVTYTWTGLGGDNNWSTAANWDTNSVPTSGSNLVFPSGAARLSNNNDLSGRTFHSVEIDESGYTISGNSITLQNGISNAFLTTFSSGSASFALDVTMAASETFDIAPGGTLALSGAISGTGFGLIKADLGTLILSGSSANTYTGITLVNDGTLALGKTAGVNAIGGDLYAGDGSGIGDTVLLMASNQIPDGSAVYANEGALFDLSTFSETFTSLTLAGASIDVGSGGVLGISGSITSNIPANDVTSTISGAGTLALSNANGTLLPINVSQDVNLNVDLRIGVGITGSNRGFQKLGNGTMALSSSSSTYDGNTNAEGGIIQVESNNALGNTNTVVVATGGSVYFKGVNLSSDRAFSLTSGAGFNGGNAIDVLTGYATLTGSILLADDSKIGAEDGATLTINGTIFDSGDPPYPQLMISNGATGRTVLGGTNTYSGNTTILSGTVAITNPFAFGNGMVTVGDGTANSGQLEIDLTGSNTVANAFVFNAPITTGLQVNSGDTTFNGATTLSSDLGINVIQGVSLAFAGAIGDGGQTKGLTKQNTGTLTLSAVNTYTGTTFVDEGLLQLNASGVSIPGNITVSGPGTAATVQELQANQIADGATVNLANAGATLDLNGFDDTIGSLSLTGSTVTTGAGTLTIHSGGGISTLASSQTATLSGHLAFDAANNFFTVAQGTTQSGVDFSVSAIVSSFANIIKDGSGTMAFSGANTYSGGTNINLGVLAISNDTGAGTGVVNILGTGTLDLSGGITVANTLNVNSSGVAIRNSGGTNTLDGTFNLGIDATIDTAASSTLAISSTVDDSGNIWSLTKTGAGTLRLDAANTYLGGTTVSSGILAISNSGALGTGNVVNNAEIDIFNNLLLNNNFTINSAGTAFLVDGLTTIQGTVTLLSNLVINTPDSANLYLNGVVSGSGFGIAKNGTGTLGLGQANTYTGGTSINGGFLQVFDGQATGTTGTLAINTGATLVLTTASYTLPSGGLQLADSTTFLVPLAGIDTLSGPVVLTGSTNFNIASGGTLNIQDQISGPGGFTKSGGGLLFLQDFSSYTGATIVSAGTLRVDGNISSSSLLTVSDTAILQGYGVVGNVSVSSGGTFAPGASPEFMSTDNLAFSGGSIYSVDIDGPIAGSQYDQTIVSGTVSLNGATLIVLPGFTPSVGDTFTIINNDGNDPVSGTFAGLPEGSSLSMGGQTFLISYVGGDGNDVVLTATVATTTQVSSNATTTTYGDQIIFTALVTAGSGAPTGLVTFYDGSAIPANLIGTATLNNLGIAVFTTTTLSASGSPHSILAAYAGSGLYGGSTSSAFSQAVNKATLTVTANNQSKLYGAAVPSLTASYSGFKNGQTLGTSGVTGSPSLTTTATSGSHVVGSPYAITASNGTLASGNYDFTFVNGQLAVTPAPLTITANNQSKKFGAPVPALTVRYNGLVNGDTSASLTTQPTVRTSATASSPVAGSPYAITASGAADGDYAISYVPGQLTVSQSATATRLTTPSSTIPVGSYATFTATVSPVSPGAGTPTGMIAFHVNGKILATLPLVNGRAQFTISPIGAGTVQLMTAEYLGSGNFQTSVSAGSIFSVVKSSSSVGLTTAVNAAKTGVRLFANVPAAANGLLPTGTATFYSNGTAIRKVALVNGQASILVQKSQAIAKNFYVVYSGDANFLASQSATIRVRKADFSTAPAGPMSTFASKSGVMTFAEEPTSMISKKAKARFQVNY
ncbi:autotransporter-associated beta strand repeat-containing protein [Tundrisphaera lichenicola]|uniref:autotransporter-associated beta strand repeat-containing protein n=1 Tax=Tundrisphaera lichenicola TaxID=2029860 RepID=UPI003EB85C4E